MPIAELEKIDIENIMDTDRVKWRGDTYAFKSTGKMPEGTLRELAIMDQLAESPNIINLVAIVVNHDNAIRGFLTPFMPSGDLQSVFEDARKSFGLGSDDDATAFDWPLKLSWARQIVQAVVELHHISAYNGNLKPQNVLIDSIGQAQLIDFLPKNTSDKFAAPELLKMFWSHGLTFESVLSTPADVYSLGLVLWAVAEERWMGMPTPVWRAGKTPNCYRDIVKRCLVLDSEAVCHRGTVPFREGGRLNSRKFKSTTPGTIDLTLVLTATLFFADCSSLGWTAPLENCLVASGLQRMNDNEKCSDRVGEGPYHIHIGCRFFYPLKVPKAGAIIG